MYRKIFVCVILVSLFSLVLFYSLPFSFAVRLFFTVFLIAGGSWASARYVSQPLDQFLSQIRSLQPQAPDNLADQRFQRFRDEQFGEASRRLREILETTGRTIHDLREDRDKFTSILDQFSTGVLSVDDDGTVVYVNPRARELLGIETDDVAGKLVSEVTRVEDVQDSIRTCLDSGDPVQTEGRRVKPDRDLILQIETDHFK